MAETTPTGGEKATDQVPNYGDCLAAYALKIANNPTVETALAAAAMHVHVRRWDMTHGDAGGPNSFYNGVISAERFIHDLADKVQELRHDQ